VQKLSRYFRYFSSLLILFVMALGLSAQISVAAPKAKAKAKTIKTQAIKTQAKEPNPRYAAIIIDANSGKTLYQENANARRYPASLTKMMTLYLLFEAMQHGRIAPETPIPVSEYASRRPPTKIGFKPGQTIAAEAAAKALITRSANDVASAIAEYLGGSEPRFAKTMTAKAHQLGMMNTNFANASGLPDNNNYSTARDMAILSLALREHFPQYYHLFNITSFSFRGQTINSHNRLVRNMKGVDGIKTGFINASGFNVATSMRSDGKSLVGVVMGGRSGASRDEHMRSLLNRSLPKASKSKKTTLLVAKAPPLAGNNVQIAQFKLPDGNNAPIPAIKVNYDAPQQDEVQVAAIEKLIEAEDPVLAFAPMVQKPALPAIEELEKLTASEHKLENQPKEAPKEAIVTTKPDIVSDIINEKPSNAPTMSDREHDALLLAALANEYPGSQPTILTMNALLEESDLNALTSPDNSEEKQESEAQEIDIFTTASISNSKKGWVIQVASAKTVREADIALYKALNAAGESLEKAEPYLKPSDEMGEQADQTRYYRARFAGFKSQKSALKSCVALQSKAIECYVLED